MNDPFLLARRSVFFRMYLVLCDLLVSSAVLNWFGVDRKRIDGFRIAAWKNTPPPPKGTHLVWFHAASTGELEILIPLIQEFQQKGIAIGVSVFSVSALPFLVKLPEGLFYSGLSPAERDWRSLFLHFDVKSVVVSKYEAWPALWAACSEIEIPLLVINAQVRSSLRWVKRWLTWFRVPLPQLYFSSVTADEKNKLEVLFPSARISVHADPRWVRVLDRAHQVKTNPQTREKLEQLLTEMDAGNCVRPFVVVGSAWLSDLKVIVPPFKPTTGTLWVVPHSLQSESLEEMRHYLEQEIPSRFVLVARMGFLLELYSIADKVWVGGGFGQGIHSTLEPAVFQVPIACGPKNVERFLETRELKDREQLTVCENSDQVYEWLKKKSPQWSEDSFLTKKESFTQLMSDCLKEYYD